MLPALVRDDPFFLLKKKKGETLELDDGWNVLLGPREI